MIMIKLNAERLLKSMLLRIPSASHSDITSKIKTAMQESRCIPTLNQKGYQMSVPSPLLHHWIQSYDEEKPLMDIGSAYGINTYQALNKGIPTIAVDTDKRHLQILQSNIAEEKRKLLLTKEGYLPCNIPVPDGSVSGVMLSEVLHYLRGEDITRALQTIYSKLIPGGKLALTALQIYMFKNKNQKRVEEFFKDKENGEKWPGLTYIDNETVSKFRNASQQQNVPFEEFGTGQPSFLHFFVLPQIVSELRRIGFEIVVAKEGMHPGYPSGDNKVPKANLQIVARKSL